MHPGLDRGGSIRKEVGSYNVASKRCHEMLSKEILPKGTLSNLAYFI